METCSLSLQGGAHACDEDYVVRSDHRSGHGRKVCLLADGQGGRPDGDIASKVACGAALDLIQGTSWEDLARTSTWDRIFCESDRKVREACEGFTSMVGLVCDSHSLFGASVGDCKTYLRNGGESIAIELTDRQHKNPPVGGGVKFATSFAFNDLRQATVLMVSDGVWKFTCFSSMNESLAAPDLLDIPLLLKSEVLNQQAGDELPDDFSVLAIRS